MHLELTIEVTEITETDEVVGFRVTACNGRYAATVDVFESRAAIAELATTFRGFPATGSDRREANWGWSPTSGGDGIRLVLSVVGASARIQVVAHSRLAEAADFTAVVEAAAIDRFVGRLDAMRMQLGETASLELSA